MSKSNHTNEVFGVDRAVVEAAILRANHERGEALRSIVRSLFGRPAASQPTAQSTSIPTGAPVHG